VEGAKYVIRQADPLDRSKSPDAHEVMLMHMARPKRLVGVWESRYAAEQVADMLNDHSREQLR
jgi:hypothetical protein